MKVLSLTVNYIVEDVVSNKNKLLADSWGPLNKLI